MKKYYVRVNGVSYEVEIEEIGAGRMAPQMVSNRSTSSTDRGTVKDNNRNADNGSENTRINSPMPGTVLKLNVQVGSRVTKGQVLLILEAMKMENEIIASSDGVVATVGANKGAQVNAGDLLLTIENK